MVTLKPLFFLKASVMFKHRFHLMWPFQAALTCTALLATACLQAQEAPTVQGPETVADWYDAGQAFMARTKALPVNQRQAKNVILFVGDGMGVTTVTAARILQGQMRGQPGEENQLSFDQFPYTALSKTYSWDQQTPDSAPTMTAMVTGYKTRDSMLSVNHTTARGECSAAAIEAKKLKTILEYAAQRGKATGIVSTARITHATPAALYAHTAARDWEADANLPTTDVNTGAPCQGSVAAVKDIARQLIELAPAVRTSLKVALGGGRTYFLPRAVMDPEYPTMAGRRLDGRNLTEEWVSTRSAQGGAAYVWNRAQFEAFDPQKSSYLLGLFEPSHVQYETDKSRDAAGEPTLTEMTDKALSVLLKERRGFFLHVEGGRIDHAHHAGNAQRALTETVEFSNAIARTLVRLKAAGQLDNTLIIVTADHSHTFTMAGYPRRGNNILGVVRAVPDIDGHAHSHEPVPPATTDTQGLPYTTLGYANGPGHRPSGRAPLSDAQTTALDFAQEAAVPLKSETHGGEDVAIYATGPQAHLVRGTLEQNWIFHIMREAFGF
jgi:alkaline phosphatase